MQPPAASAPRWAAASIPNAPPDTIVTSWSAAPEASSAATYRPYSVAARAPTNAQDRAVTARRSARPRTHSASGGPRARRWCRPHPERQRRRPLGIAGTDQPGTDGGGGLQVSVGVEGGEPGLVVAEPAAREPARADAVVGSLGALLGDEASQGQVTGFAQTGQSGPGPAFGRGDLASAFPCRGVDRPQIRRVRKVRSPWSSRSVRRSRGTERNPLGQLHLCRPGRVGWTRHHLGGPRHRLGRCRRRLPRHHGRHGSDRRRRADVVAECPGGKGSVSQPQGQRREHVPAVGLGHVRPGPPSVQARRSTRSRVR